MPSSSSLSLSKSMIATLMCVALAACGGGDAGDKAEATASALISPVTEAASAVAASESTADAASSPASSASSGPTVKMLAVAYKPTSTTTGSTGGTATSGGTRTASATTSSFSTTLAQTSLTTASLLGAAATMTTLSTASPTTTMTTTVSTTSTTCKIAYTAPSSLTLATPATRPASGGVFFSNTELTAWKSRVATGPFVHAGDYTKGSPGDFERVLYNAGDFLRSGDKGPTSTTVADDYARLGTTARDAAFVFLLTADGKSFTAVRDYLVAQTTNPAVNFPNTLCLTDNNNWTPDAYYFQASWLLRYIVAYDFVRSAMSSADRVTVENFIRRNAYFFATQMDYALQRLFPNRLSGDYSKKAWVAAATTDADMWWSKRYDTNGDCSVNSLDKSTPDAVYAYVRSDGKVGPRLSVLSQFYNNRRAASSLAVGAAGVTLADPVLVANAKRYVFEWLTYGVWSDGSQGEYARNGDYCIPQQGVIYGGTNNASAALLATLLTRQGDTSVQSFSTIDGLFGTQSVDPAPPKTLELAVRTQLSLINGSLKWYYHQPWRSTQDLTDANSLMGMRSYYMKSTKATDNFHELGLLPAAKLLPNVSITGMAMRDKAVTTLPFPGSTGNAVSTGWGVWSDPFNALPAVFLTRP